MSKFLSKQFAKIHPSVGVLLVALAGVALCVGAHLMSVEQVAADVDLSDTYIQHRVSRQQHDEAKILTADFEGPVARMAGRMREASGLALVLGLARVNEAIQKRPAPADVDALVALVVGQRLLPLGVTIPDPLNRRAGVLLGPHATLYVRYRVAPFGIEVVSIGNTKDDGAAILIRLPNDEETAHAQMPKPGNKENPGAALYVSDHLDAVTIPAAFSSPASMLLAGWQPDEFHALDLPQDRVNELNDWLRNTTQK
jgi:hypothetical protein